MKTTVEISKYPLYEDYEPPILDFIQRLNANENLTIKTNATSTQISGYYDEVMGILQKRNKNFF